ncbi:MAG TPA: alpha-mannosidase, partial [Ruminococcaceae bacterium]|nr:alpha-mannosidase [Oscillospiraceae bacterium]
EWEEGAAEALSTFRIAADFCEEYDGFVFCHNEALLYEWIEEYDRELFERIRSLAARGKWHIMGGWLLQPDCNMPAGEFFVRQILWGRQYFKEKFNVTPTVAVNVDSFGHSRGLVQIMNKFGYKGYMGMRPSKHFIDLPDGGFKWKGYDDSEVICLRTGGYSSGKGKVGIKIRTYVDDCAENDIGLCLWGIGNHGGGPSKEDLDTIVELQNEYKAQDVTLVHSTPEEYFEEIGKKDLPVIEKSLNPWAPGCYTSQCRVKQKYRYAENTYFTVESMCTRASMDNLIEYPKTELREALHDILTVQFHDMLPGSSIKDAEEMGLRMLDHALEILSRLRAKAFFALASGQKKAPSDKIPFFAYNPYPYPITGDFVAEFNLWDMVWDKCYFSPVVYDENGTVISSQCEKERSTIPIEWRKRVVFSATLKPMSMNRFECAFEKKEEKPKADVEATDTHFLVNAGDKVVEINRKTGLIDCYRDNKTDYLKSGALALEVWQDNYDPWYMETTKWDTKIGEFKLLNQAEATEFMCLKEPIDSVHIIESGAVRTVIEAVFGYNRSRACVKYIISSNGELETDIKMEWLEKQKLVKLNIPTAFVNAKCIGEEPYGREEMRDNLEENVAHKYLTLFNDTNAISVLNKGTYGSSLEDGALKMTLLRSPSYCSHPINEEHPTMPKDRFMQHIEIGEREFCYKIVAGEKAEILNKSARLAQLYNSEPMCLSFYPTGMGELPSESVTLADTDIVQMTAFKKAEAGRGSVIRLFNPTADKQTATLKFNEKTARVCFGKYEIKTVLLDENGFAEADIMA